MLIGRGIDRKAGQAALALSLAVVAVPAAASTAPITAYYRDPAVPPSYVYPGPDKAIIAIDVLASVGGRCGFATGGAPNGTINAGSIDTTGWNGNVPFVPECSAPWRIAVSSQNGALKTAGSVPTGYRTLAPYDVKLNIPYNDGTTAGTVVATCPVAQLDAALGSSACTFKGTASTTNGLQVPRSFGLSGAYIQASAPAYPGPDVLVSGSYTDTLTVTVSPSV